MLLAIDVGNTQTVLGLFREQELLERWRISSDASMTADEVRLTTAGLLGLGGRSWDDVHEVVLASVVPRLTSAWGDVVGDERTLLTVGPGLKTGLVIRYDNPHEVGADRIVNAIAAVEYHGAPVIVVDFGTATTLDVISPAGEYLGGAIAPGVETSAEALFAKAARLSKVDLEPPASVIGTNTRASVQAGLVLGEAVMVDGLVRRVHGELGCEATVIATGGLAPRMAGICETVDHVDVDLTLKGLRIIRDRNR
jgi:type III pantothenate kinase